MAGSSSCANSAPALWAPSLPAAGADAGGDGPPPRLLLHRAPCRRDSTGKARGCRCRRRCGRRCRVGRHGRCLLRWLPCEPGCCSTAGLYLVFAPVSIRPACSGIAPFCPSPGCFCGFVCAESCSLCPGTLRPSPAEFFPPSIPRSLQWLAPPLASFWTRQLRLLHCPASVMPRQTCSAHVTL